MPRSSQLFTLYRVPTVPYLRRTMRREISFTEMSGSTATETMRNGRMVLSSVKNLVSAHGEPAVT